MSGTVGAVGNLGGVIFGKHLLLCADPFADLS